MSEYTLECEICKCEFAIETYGDGVCPLCGQRYIYEEGHQIVLTDEDKEILRNVRIGKI